MTSTQNRDLNHIVHLRKTDREIASHLEKLGLGNYAATILASLRTRHLTQFDFMQIFEAVNSKRKKESDNKIPKHKNQFKVAEGLSEIREIFLFSWDDENELIDFLHQNYGLTWVETAKIERIDEGRTIKVCDGTNNLTLTLDDNWKIIHERPKIMNSYRYTEQKYSTKVNLIIDDGRRDEFEGKMMGIPAKAKLKIFKNRGWLDEREKNKRYKVYSLKIQKKHYLFCWDEIPGKDDGKLVKFLVWMYGINWIKGAKIERINEGIIKISSGKKYLLLKLKDETKVILIIKGGRTFELNVRTEIENNKLNIYNTPFQNIIAELEEHEKEIWKKKLVTIGQLDEKNTEITDSLISLGKSRSCARVLNYFKNKNEVTSDELERSTGVRQPGVSIAIKRLKKHDWINEREEKKPGKGRPYRIYSLKVGFKDIIAHIEKEQKNEIDDKMASIKQLKELVQSSRQPKVKP